ncbi:MAG: putative DNA-binding domain-containing protein [Ichthyobacteriaceae bacterium]|nr:putative DNA-binding domain-containing protein [Ichthyobacteriaceae bacterium]
MKTHESKNKLKFTSGKEIQDSMGHYMLTGDTMKFNNSKEEGLKAYRDLIFNNFEGSIETAFPIFNKILSNKEWELVVADFFENNKSQYNELWKLPKEFVEYFEDKKYAEAFNKPYLNNLLSFEWMEVEVFNMSDVDFPEYKKEGNINTDVLVVNPEYSMDVYDYPIHKINIEKKELDKIQTIIITYRNIKTKNAEYVSLSVLDAFIFEQIIESKISFNKAISIVEKQLNEKLPNDVVSVSEKMFEELLSNSLFLGYKI